MAIGQFLCIGDKTSCGGTIISASSVSNIDNRAICCEFDSVTCGKHPGIYKILGGVNYIKNNGRRLVGTLDSYSSCPCRAIFIREWQGSDHKKAINKIIYSSTENSPALLSIEPLSPLAAAHNSLTPVFAKSCLRDSGCTKAGITQEPHNNFGYIGYYLALTDNPAPKKKSIVNAARVAVHRVSSRLGHQGLFKRGNRNNQVAGTAIAKITKSTCAAPTLQRQMQTLHYTGGELCTAGTWACLTDKTAPFIMGVFYASKLHSDDKDFIDNSMLLQLAKVRGKAKTRVRFRWEIAKQGQCTPMGYHTSDKGGMDLVPVRLLEYNTRENRYEFCEEIGRENSPILIWTAAKTHFVAANSINYQTIASLPLTITVYPEKEMRKHSLTMDRLSGLEKKFFRDYILVHPEGKFDPLYIYLATEQNC